jgi:tetratricopeptide (TPR) repeat protein
LKNSNNISQELLETVERHLNKTMSKQEALDFELRLAEDPQFRTHVADIKTLLLGIGNQSLKERLDEFHEALPESQMESSNGKTKSTMLWGKFAAAILIFAAIGGFWWFSTTQNERLYAEYFTPDPGLPTTMSSSTNFEFYDAMVDYKQGNYKIAIEKWELLESKQPGNDTLNYFLGVARLANKDEVAAIAFLEKSTQHPDFVLIQDAYYYLGLAYLKAGQIEKAKLNLTKSKLEDSKELLSKIKD